MEFFGLSEAIECDAAYVVAKKIVPSQPLNHELFGQCMKYVCSRDGEATVVQELQPKESLLENSRTRLDAGDSIRATRFYVMHRGYKPCKKGKVRFSGEHNANAMTTTTYTYAEISQAFGGKPDFMIDPEFVSPIKQLEKKID